METSQLMEIAFKINEVINYYWNFYIFVYAIIMGWLFTADIHWEFIKRAAVSVGFLLFAGINGTALHKNYALLTTTFQEINTKTELGTSLFMQSFITTKGIGTTGVIIIHTVMDVAMLALIWFYTRTKKMKKMMPSPFIPF